MIPRGIGFFIVILLIDMFLGKLTEKNRNDQNTGDIWGKQKQEMFKDEKSQVEKVTKPNIKKEEAPNIKRKRISDFKRDEIAKPIEKNDYSPVNDYFEIGDMIEKTEKENQKKYRKKEIKKDLLKGIIFSEILSKPKSIENREKSI